MEHQIKIQNSNKRGKSEDCWTTSFLQCKEIFYIVSQTYLLFSLIWWEKYETTLYKTWIFLGRSCGFLKLNCDFVRTFFFYKFPPRRHSVMDEVKLYKSNIETGSFWGFTLNLPVMLKGFPFSWNVTLVIFFSFSPLSVTWIIHSYSMHIFKNKAERRADANQNCRQDERKTRGWNWNRAVAIFCW